eukprot:1160718-Pelagomonas_calceolata.AAC.9
MNLHLQCAWSDERPRSHHLLCAAPQMVLTDCAATGSASCTSSDRVGRCAATTRYVQPKSVQWRPRNTPCCMQLGRLVTGKGWPRNRLCGVQLDRLMAWCRDGQETHCCMSGSWGLMNGVTQQSYYKYAGVQRAHACALGGSNWEKNRQETRLQLARMRNAWGISCRVLIRIDCFRRVPVPVQQAPAVTSSFPFHLCGTGIAIGSVADCMQSCASLQFSSFAGHEF